MRVHQHTIKDTICFIIKMNKDSQRSLIFSRKIKVCNQFLELCSAKIPMSNMKNVTGKNDVLISKCRTLTQDTSNEVNLHISIRNLQDSAYLMNAFLNECHQKDLPPALDEIRYGSQSSTKIKRQDFVCKETVTWHILNINDIRKIILNFEERWMVDKILDPRALQVVVRVNQRWKMSAHSSGTTDLTDCRRSRLCFHDEDKRKVKGEEGKQRL